MMYYNNYIMMYYNIYIMIYYNNYIMMYYNNYIMMYYNHCIHSMEGPELFTGPETITKAKTRNITGP